MPQHLPGEPLNAWLQSPPGAQHFSQPVGSVGEDAMSRAIICTVGAYDPASPFLCVRVGLAGDCLAQVTPERHALALFGNLLCRFEGCHLLVKLSNGSVRLVRGGASVRKDGVQREQERGRGIRERSASEREHAGAGDPVSCRRARRDARAEGAEISRARAREREREAQTSCTPLDTVCMLLGVV